MKKTINIMIAAVTVVAMSCSKESIKAVSDQEPKEAITPQEQTNEPGMQTITISASTEGIDTKTLYDGGTDFKWQSGDKISVLCTDGSFYDFVANESGDPVTFTGTIPDGENLGAFALFPADATHSTTKFHLPKEKDLRPNGSADLPMYGVKGSGKSFAFTHMTGAIKLTIDNFPADITYATISLTNPSLKLTGYFSIKEDGLYHKWNAEGSSNPDDQTFIRTVPVKDNCAVVYMPYAYCSDLWANCTLNITGYNSSDVSTKLVTDVTMKGNGSTHARATVIPYTPLILYNTPNFSLPGVVTKSCGASHTQVKEMKAYADKYYIHLQFHGETASWTGTKLNLYIYDGGGDTDVKYPEWSLKKTTNQVYSEGVAISTSALALSMGGKTCKTSVESVGDDTYWTISVPRTAHATMMGSSGTVYAGIMIQDDTWACTGAVPEIWTGQDMLAVSLP